MSPAAAGPVPAALAAAFLTGGWEPAALARRGARTLGLTRRVWLERLAADLVGTWPDAPRDRPREVAAAVAGHPALQAAAEAAHRRGTPLAVRHLTCAGTAMGPTPWPVPPLPDLPALAALLRLEPAELDWFADVRGVQRRAGRPALHHYRSRWVAKRGTPRLLEAPRPRLRVIQRRLLSAVLAPVPPHPAAHGFVPGRSALTAAAAHTGRRVVVRVDLAAFFASVPAGRVYRVFRTAGYPEPVAHVLTGLCTHRTPSAVLAAMPPGGGPEDRFGLRRWLREAHLPQGAPTSPALANLCAQRLDRRLAGLAAAGGATYTRYADDLVLSGGEDVRRRADRLVASVAAIAGEEGFAVNPAKTRVQGAGGRQVVTGLVVNARPNVPRAEFDALKALLHNAARTGPEAQNREGHPDFRAHLAGRVTWVESVNPARGARLRAEFERIAW
ncbi:hypothetical protein NUM3379_14820 [Kineococcus sp. NUM-3379]